MAASSSCRSSLRLLSRSWHCVRRPEVPWRSRSQWLHGRRCWCLRLARSSSLPWRWMKGREMKLLFNSLEEKARKHGEMERDWWECEERERRVRRRKGRERGIGWSNCSGHFLVWFLHDWCCKKTISFISNLVSIYIASPGKQEFGIWINNWKSDCSFVPTFLNDISMQ